jgi:hypothetical protein
MGERVKGGDGKDKGEGRGEEGKEREGYVPQCLKQIDALNRYVHGK